MMVLRIALILAAGVFMLGMAPAAHAAITSVTMDDSASPSAQGADTFGGSSLALSIDATDDGTYVPVVKEAVLHFDDDFAFDTTGLAECPSSSIQGTSTAQAIAACPGAQVGSGSATYTGASGTLPAVITAFNGQPWSGHPVMLLHLDLDNDAVITVVWGIFGPSSRGGDFGTQIDFSFPNSAGLSLTHLDLTISNQEPTPGHHYLSARCNDSDHTWNYGGDFTDYADATLSAAATQLCTPLADAQPQPGGGGSVPASGAAFPIAPGPTGQRARALKKCSRKRGRARVRCTKRARKLPV